MNIAIIGYGFHGKNILRACENVPGLVVAAVCDADSAQLQYLPSGIKAYSEHTSLLSDPNIEAVVIASPASTHRRIAEDVSYACMPMELEKPIAANRRDMEAILDACSRRSTKLMVGMTGRYHPEFRKAYEIAGKGEIGQVKTISESIVIGQRNFPAHYVAEDNGGGVLLENGVHAFQHLLALSGSDIRRILSARLGNHFLGGYHEDTAFVQLEQQNGVQSALHLQWMPYDFMDYTVNVYGEKGMVVVKGFDSIMVSNGETHEEKFHKDGETLEQRHIAGVSAQLRDFMAFVKGVKQPDASLEEAFKAHENVFRVYELCGRPK